jgi:alanyl-tRNA synthetase
MHSAEHLLNQTMVRMFHRGRSFSTHIEKRKSKCDYHFDRDLGEDERRELEARVNDVIMRDVPVHVGHMTRDEAAREFDLARLPEAVGDEVRIVSIGDYDACPCRGQHVARSGEIGRFRIISTSFADGVLRIRFRLEHGDFGMES